MTVTGEDDDPFPDPSPEHMLQFSLNVKCKMVKGAKEGGDPSKIYVHSQGTHVAIISCSGNSERALKRATSLQRSRYLRKLVI